MRRSRILGTIVLLVSVVAVQAAGSQLTRPQAHAAAPAPLAGAVVDPDNVYVSDFEGWGTALAWGANVVGGWSDAKRTKIADLLFSRSGLGLNVVRYHIGGGLNPNWQQVGCGEHRPGSPLPTFAPSQGQWNGSADANQRWFAQAAQDRGADKYLAYASSAPYWMTRNGCSNGGDGRTSGGAWGHDGDGTGAHNGTTSYSERGNASVDLAFQGTQVAFYAAKSNDSGKAAISIDGGQETTVDLYSPTRQGNQRVYTSPTLSSGTHSLKVRVLGKKNASSSDTFVSVDRVVIAPDTPDAVSIDDQTQGTGLNQFSYGREYGGQNLKGYWGYDGDGTGAHNGTASYSQETGDSVTVRFTGTQISFYASKSTDGGKAAISVDGGAETTVDLYASARQGNQLVYTSTVLPSGTHTLKVRVTGTKNASSSGHFVSPDRVVVQPGGTSIDDQVRGTGLNQFNYHWNMYEPFADHLTEVTKHFRDQYGITFDLLDPLNEPEGGWSKYGNQEGAHFDWPSQDEIVNRVGQSLDAKGLSETTVAAPDAFSVDASTSAFNYYSSTAKDYISTVNTHTYGTSPADAQTLRNTAANHDKRLWMSEYGTGEASIGSPSGGMDPVGAQPAINLASQIVNDLTNLRPSAWILWDGIESWEQNEVEDVSWGLIWAKYLDSNETYTVAKQYYGYANFTKFIRPGDNIIASNDASTVAAYDPATNKVVLVVHNDSDTSRWVDYDLTKFGAINTATPYRTSGTEELAQLPDVAMTGNHLTTTLAPKSVTTFVMPGISNGGDPWQLVSELSDKCASVADWSTADGAAIVQWGCGAGSANQSWTLEPVGQGRYQVVSTLSDKCASVANWSTADGAAIVQWGCSAGSANQLWKVEPVGTGYHLRSVHSDKCASVADWSTANGAAIVQWACGTGSVNQGWRLE